MKFAKIKNEILVAAKITNFTVHKKLKDGAGPK